MFKKNYFIFILNFYILFIECLPAKQPKTGYNETIARALLNLAAGAYGVWPEKCVKKTFPYLNTPNNNNNKIDAEIFSSQRKICDFFGNKCSSYHFADTPSKHLYIVFRGTSTKAQLLSEAWFSLNPSQNFYDLGKSNKYFVNALEILWPNVEKALTKYSNFKVTFTGHSLGGAMASLAALKTVYKEFRHKNDVILYTFGQPRVGNVVLAKSHDKFVPNSFRIVHSIDIVPHLPGCEKREIMGASTHPCNPDHLEHPYHHGIEIYYPHEMHKNSTYLECLGAPFGEDYGCSDMLTFIPEHHFQYFYAHTHYFEHKVSARGKLGCIGTREEEDDLPHDYGKEKKDQPSFKNVIKAVQFAATLFG